MKTTPTKMKSPSKSSVPSEIHHHHSHEHHPVAAPAREASQPYALLLVLLSVLALFLLVNLPPHFAS